MRALALLLLVAILLTAVDHRVTRRHLGSPFESIGERDSGANVGVPG
jgi:hypothetical protein